MQLYKTAAGVIKICCCMNVYMVETVIANSCTC